MNLLQNGNIVLSGAITKPDSVDFEESVLKQLNEMSKNLYETQQKQRKDYELLKSEIENKQNLNKKWFQNSLKTLSVQKLLKSVIK